MSSAETEKPLIDYASCNTITMALLKLQQEIKLTVQHAEAMYKYTHTGKLHMRHNVLFASYFTGWEARKKLHLSSRMQCVRASGNKPVPMRHIEYSFAFCCTRRSVLTGVTAIHNRPHWVLHTQDLWMERTTGQDLSGSNRSSFSTLGFISKRECGISSKQAGVLH